MSLDGKFFRVFSSLMAALIALTLTVSSTRAQTETPAPLRDVTVAVTVIGRANRLSAELVGLPVQNQLQTDFAAAGFRVMRAQPDQAQLWVQLTPNNDKTLTAALTPRDSFLAKLPSPILIPTVAPVIFTGPQNDAFTQTISGTTLALSSAIQNDCTSTPIHADGLNQDDIGLITSAVDFYAGNCSLAAGEFTGASAQYLDSLDSLTQANAPVSAQIAPTVNLAWLAYKEGRATVAVNMLTDLFGKAKLPADRVLILSKRSALRALDFQFADAIADMKAAITESPNDPSLYVDLGQRILLTYEWDQVLDAYNQAIAIDPTYAPAYFQRGILFYTEGPRANALNDFQKYLELAPDGEYANEASTYIDGIQQTTAGEIQQGK